MRLFDFLNILALLTLFTGMVCLIDFILSRNAPIAGRSLIAKWIVENCRAFFPVFLIVLLIRAFVFQPYRVPTGSLEPTVMPGDLIFVTQYNYGLKLPLWDKIVYPIGHPQRGEIALFRWPVNPEMTFVKRVIGVPGDRISYVNKVLYVNGKQATQETLGAFQEDLGRGQARMVQYFRENLPGATHDILINPDVDATNFKDLVIPAGQYLMVGDNRDNSDDSRDWGFVPEHNFIGRARFVWFNIQLSPFKMDWKRIGTKL